MTDRERLNSEIDNFRHMILGLLADEALDAGDAELAWGYHWLARWRKWPVSNSREHFPDDQHKPRWFWLKQAGSTLTYSLEYEHVLNNVAYDSESEALEAAARAVAEALMPKE